MKPGQKPVRITGVSITLIATCLWCEKEIPFNQNIKGRMLCSIKCLRDINKKIADPEYFYTKDEVIK